MSNKGLGLFFKINILMIFNLFINMWLGKDYIYTNNYPFYFLELWVNWSYIIFIFLFIFFIFTKNKKTNFMILSMHLILILISSRFIETQLDQINSVQDYKINNKHMQRNGVSVISANINMQTQSLREILDKAKKYHPDYIFLFEVTNQDKEFLKNFHQLGYFTYDKLEDTPYGMALISKYPIMGDKNHEIMFNNYYIYFKQNISMLDNGEVKEGKKTICGALFHPPPPLTFELYKIRNKEYQSVIEKMKNCDADYKIIAGDMNATALTGPLKSILDENMKSTTQLESTWNSQLSLDNYYENFEIKWKVLDRAVKFIAGGYYLDGFGLGIGIDHVFIEKNHVFKDLEFFYIKGGDHLGIYTNIIFKD